MEIFFMLCGVVIALVGAYWLVKLLMLKKRGTLTEAEVVSANKIKENEYDHILRFELDGKTVEHRLKTSFSKPFAVGSKHYIYVDAKDVDFIKLADRMNYNIMLFAAPTVMGVLFAVRWLLLAMK